jgi:flagellar M-ring protein FliF
MNEPNETKDGGGTAEFFRHVIVQPAALWQKFSLQRKLIAASLVGITLVGLLGLLFFAHTGGASGMLVLCADLDVEEAAQITEHLNRGGYRYKLENNGRNVLVNSRQLYEIRTALARDGVMPKGGILGNKNLILDGRMTRPILEQNIRPLERELQRAIESMDEVRSARVHLLPAKRPCLGGLEEAKVSVLIRFIPGREMSKEQIRGITNFLASAVDGLKPQNVSVVDAATGELLPTF